MKKTIAPINGLCRLKLQYKEIEQSREKFRKSDFLLTVTSQEDDGYIKLYTKFRRCVKDYQSKSTKGIY